MFSNCGRLVIFASCQYEFIEAPPPPELPEPGDTTYFSTEVAPIFEENGCTPCHNGGLAFDLTAENAYANIIANDLVEPLNPEASKIWYYPEPVNGQHNSKYTSSNANTIYVWILQGALDN
ncbi:MAG: hypothetical protein R2764_13895 [Bacteroidales bacterium]